MTKAIHTPSLLPKKKILFFGLGAAILFIILAFLTPISMGDETDKLTGLEKAVAKQTLQRANTNINDVDRLSTPYLSVHVDSVYKTPTNEAGQRCGGAANQETDGHYSVIVSYRTIFGIPIRTYTARNCAPPYTFYDEQSGRVEVIR